jgi:hypothetical protein
MSPILIDDSNTVVMYNPPAGWIKDGIVQEFNQMAHVSMMQGDTATLVFEGVSAPSVQQYVTKPWNLKLRDVH